MLYVGIDPSYTKTGVAYIDLDNKQIIFNAITPPGSNKTYNDAIQRARYVAEHIEGAYEPLLRKKTYLIEEPLVTSQMSSRLGILSGVVGTSIYDMSRFWGTKVYSINPNAVSNTNRRVRGYTSKTKKNISREMVYKYLEEFESVGYEITILNDKLNKDGSLKKRILSTDEAEAFIMALILVRHLGVLDKELEQNIIRHNRGLNTDITINELGELSNEKMD